jgi:hypothetical protein
VKFNEKRGYRCLKIYKAFGEDLGKYLSLGVRKLEILAGLPSLFAFLMAHQLKELEAMNSDRLREIVRQFAGSESRHARSGKASGEFRITVSRDGTRLVLTNLTKELQDELKDHLTDWLRERFPEQGESQEGDTRVTRDLPDTMAERRTEMESVATPGLATGALPKLSGTAENADTLAPDGPLPAISIFTRNRGFRGKGLRVSAP